MGLGLGVGVRVRVRGRVRGRVRVRSAADARIGAAWELAVKVVLLVGCDVAAKHRGWHLLGAGRGWEGGWEEGWEEGWEVFLEGVWEGVLGGGLGGGLGVGLGLWLGLWAEGGGGCRGERASLQPRAVEAATLGGAGCTPRCEAAHHPVDPEQVLDGVGGGLVRVRVGARVGVRVRVRVS